MVSWRPSRSHEESGPSRIPSYCRFSRNSKPSVANLFHESALATHSVGNPAFWGKRTDSRIEDFHALYIACWLHLSGRDRAPNDSTSPAQRVQVKRGYERLGPVSESLCKDMGVLLPGPSISDRLMMSWFRWKAVAKRTRSGRPSVPKCEGTLSYHVGHFTARLYKIKHMDGKGPRARERLWLRITVWHTRSGKL